MADAGLQVVDITNRANPTIVGSVGTPYVARGVYVSGNYAYVASGTYGTCPDEGACDEGGFQVIEISDPRNPTIVGSVVMGGPAHAVFVSGNYSYVATDSGLQVVDVSDPRHPTIVGSVKAGGSDVYVSGNYSYVAANGSGLKVIDISDPKQPTVVGSGATPDARGVFVSGNYAYVTAMYSGLQIIDVSNHVNPTLFGSADTGRWIKI